MINDQLFLKREILQKEEERHRLTYLGVIDNFEKAVDTMLFQYNESCFTKTGFLDYFYTKVVGYSNFIATQKTSNIKLKMHLFYFSNMYLKRKKDKMQALLDKELAYNKISIGYFFPLDVFEEYYALFCSCSRIFNTPTFVNEFFQEYIDNQYPLSIQQYLQYLRKNISSFWSVTCSYVKEIIEIAARHLLFVSLPKEQTDLIKDAAWSDTYEILQNKLQTDNTLFFKSGTDFRNYVVQICNYRLQNQRLKYTSKEESIELYPYLELEEDEQSDNLESSWLDIDIHNSYEVAYAISIILLNSEHPLYKKLTQGLEDKVDILLRKVIEGQSYNHIVEAKYNLLPGSSNFVKTVTKTRKEYERVRKTLQERFINIKKEQEKCHI